jgi:hypothetical protein
MALVFMGKPAFINGWLVPASASHPARIAIFLLNVVVEWLGALAMLGLPLARRPLRAVEGSLPLGRACPAQRRPASACA